MTLVPASMRLNSSCLWPSGWLGLLLLGALTLTRLGADEPTREQLDFFESKIRPLLIERCVECHNDDDPESGLSVQSLDGLLRGGTLGAALVPGKPKESLLISSVNHDAFLKMPPKDKLATAELVALSKWVAMGAPWPKDAKAMKVESVRPPTKEVAGAESESRGKSPSFTDEQKSFWAFQSLRQPEPPHIAALEQQPRPIDAFILDKLRDQGITPAPAASKRDLIRRATYDLLGLPPEEAEIQRYESDLSPDAYPRLLDRLLASPRYGERWGRHWLDVARYAESNGLDENIAYANAFRYRDYVVSSFNNDKPYERFLQEQVAGDLMSYDPQADAAQGDAFDRLVATGFLAIGAKMLAEDDPVKMQMDIIDEQLTTMCQAFMGLTIGCARCHDHKFDPLPTTDYYALAGIFKSTQTMENHRVVAKWYERPLLSEADAAQLKSIDAELKAYRDELTQFEQKCRQQAVRRIRGSVAKSLLAVQALERFNRASQALAPRGVGPTDKPFKVSEGYALIEAEAFHRGTVARDTENYGKEIGVILTSGGAWAEYDLDVEQAGHYVLELRYAAVDSRPVRLLIDNIEVRPAIAAGTTGGWNAEKQAWSIAATVELTVGPHVLKLDSGNVFPHIDQLALVLNVEDEDETARWPFGKEPMTLSRATRLKGFSPESGLAVVSLWRDYLAGLDKGRNEDAIERQFWSAWKALCNLTTEPPIADLGNNDLGRADLGSADLGSADISSRLEDLLKNSTKLPSQLKERLERLPAKTLAQAADAFQATIEQSLNEQSLKDEGVSEADRALRAGLVRKGSPLQTPKENAVQFYTDIERREVGRLQQLIQQAESRRPQAGMAMGVTESKPEDLKVHLRGSHLVLGESVPRRFPTIFTSVIAPDVLPAIDDTRSGRLELAQWMTRPDHPLTSRVMANRIWHWHFGRGIVPSVDNFGLLGLPPSHPELLDWLALEFVRHGWSIKHLHREIMLSETYQRSTQHVPQAAEADPENQWLWRFRRRRLTGEETRDSILAVGAGLDNQMYGSLMKVENHKYVNTTGGRGTLDYDAPRRTIYLPIIRSGVYDVLQTLDFPDPAMINGQRQTSTVASQALLMMNSDLVREQAALIARDVIAAGHDDAMAISAIYHRVLKRPPTPIEIGASAAFINQSLTQSEPLSRHECWVGLSRVLMSSNEFSYVD